MIYSVYIIYSDGNTSQVDRRVTGLKIAGRAARENKALEIKNKKKSASKQERRSTFKLHHLQSLFLYFYILCIEMKSLPSTVDI